MRLAALKIEAFNRERLLLGEYKYVFKMVNIIIILFPFPVGDSEDVNGYVNGY